MKNKHALTLADERCNEYITCIQYAQNNMRRLNRLLSVQDEDHDTYAGRTALTNESVNWSVCIIITEAKVDSLSHVEAKQSIKINRGSTGLSLHRHLADCKQQRNLQSVTKQLCDQIKTFLFSSQLAKCDHLLALKKCRSLCSENSNSSVATVKLLIVLFCNLVGWLGSNGKFQHIFAI